jgi:GTP-binding protein
LNIRSVSFYRGAYSPADFPRDRRPQFAIVGRSNVGKSSLINSILGRKAVARVSQTPGKTQAIHFYLVNEKFYIVDLPGYGYAKVAKSVMAGWGKLIQSYLDESEELRMVFLLLDARRIPSDQDLTMVEWMNEAAIPWRAVLTKTDKVSNNQLAQSAREIARTLGQTTDELIFFSKVTRRGVDALWHNIEAVMHESAGRAGAARF